MSETKPKTQHKNSSRPLVGFRICHPESPEKLRPFDDSWLFEQLRKKYRLSTSAPPDVVLCAYTSKSPPHCLQSALKFRRYFGFRPYLGLVCMENLRLNPSWSDFSITWQPTAGDNFYLPMSASPLWTNTNNGALENLPHRWNIIVPVPKTNSVSTFIPTMFPLESISVVNWHATSTSIVPGTA